MKSNPLLKQVIQETGLPAELIEPEIINLIKSQNKNIEDISLEDLRNILIKYLQEVLFHCVNRDDEHSPH